MRTCSTEGCAEPKGGVMLGYVLPCCYCCVYVAASMHCLINTIACMYWAWTQHTELMIYQFIWGDICASICPLWFLYIGIVHVWSILWAHLSDAPLSMCAWRCMRIFTDHCAVQILQVDTSHWADWENAPALIYVHTMRGNNAVNTLGLWVEV